MNFFKTFLAAFLAIFAVVVAVMLIFGLSIAGIAASGGSKKVSVKDKSILHLQLNGQVVENAEPEDFNIGEIFPGADVTEKIGLYQTVRALEQAKTDDKIKGIYLNPGMVFEGGWASLKTIHDALIDFKSSGKFIYAYAEAYSEKTYYLASVADSIFMPPSGIVEFNGLVSNPMFLTGMFEKLEIQPKIYRVGTFKSAVEPYFLKEMSEPSKMQTREYLTDLWAQFADDVALSRKIDRAEVDSIAANFVFGDGKEALKRKLIDKMGFEEDVWTIMRTKTDVDKDKKPNFVSLGKYIKTVKAKNEDADDKIAVIFAEGSINSGKSGDGSIGSETIIAQLRKARADKDVKAIVLRVNSPGGSALASDVMNEEIKVTKAVKPVVASMGDVAASGGYYISSNCDYIFAEKNTITGSIGIFGVLFNTQKMFNNKLGITFDEVETHANSDFLNPNLPGSAFQDNLMQKYVEDGYGDFLQVVKTGRKFADTLEVDKIAQGRVWSGLDAKNIKLIDEFGNLDAAIAKAAKLANLPEKEYGVELLPKAKNKFEEIFNQSTETFYSQMKQQEPLHEEFEMLRKVKTLFPHNGLYMLAPIGEIK